VAERALSLPVAPPPGMLPWLLAATDPARRVVFLDTSALGAEAFERPGAAKVGRCKFTLSNPR